MTTIKPIPPQTYNFSLSAERVLPKPMDQKRSNLKTDQKAHSNQKIAGPAPLEQQPEKKDNKEEQVVRTIQTAEYRYARSASNLVSFVPQVAGGIAGISLGFIGGCLAAPVLAVCAAQRGRSASEAATASVVQGTALGGLFSISLAKTGAVIIASPVIAIAGQIGRRNDKREGVVSNHSPTWKAIKDQTAPMTIASLM